MAAAPWASPTAGATTLGQLIKSSAIFNLRNTWSINKQRTSSFLPCTLLRSRIPSFPSVSVAADGADSPFDPSPPPIEHEYIDAITVPGAIISDNRVTETFQNDEAALDAANHGVAVVDLSDWGRIRVSGEDRIQFLHNQSTADFECLREGQGCDTVFVTPTARTIDIAYAWIMRNAIILTLSPQTCKDIREMLAKYIFFADKVEIQDITSQTCLFVLVGPLSNQVMESLGLNSIVGCPYGTHHHFQVNGMPITVGVGNLISEAGYSMMMAPDAAKLVWTKLIGQNVIPMGSNAWERLRIHQGRPTPGKELTSEFNVLEAGLWNMISTNKGCYKGQETISRLITYNGVKQSLYGIILSGPAQPGSAITIGGTRVGKLTSCTVGRYGPDHVGLGYIKRKAASTGGRVVVGDDVVGTLVDVPYLAWQSAPLRNPI